MHRSGTSALAGVISLLGAALPASLLPAAADNPSGFWESAAVLGVNDRILGEAGHAWYDCLNFDSATLDDKARLNALMLIMLGVKSDFPDDRLLLIKDPRLCLLLELWLAALQMMQISPATLLVLRHPDEVMASLATRDGLPAAFSTALWLRYMLAAEYASRGCPRQIVPYDMLFRDWRGCLMRVGSQVGVSWPVSPDMVSAQEGMLLDAGLRHHYAARPAVQSVGTPLGLWADETYETMLALGAQSTEAPLLQRLDRVHAAFRDWCRDEGGVWSRAIVASHIPAASYRFDVPQEWVEMTSKLSSTLPRG